MRDSERGREEERGTYGLLNILVLVLERDLKFK